MRSASACVLVLYGWRPTDDAEMEKKHGHEKEAAHGWLLA